MSALIDKPLMFATVALANKDVPISELVQSKTMKKSANAVERRLGALQMRYIDGGYPQQDGGYIQTSPNQGGYIYFAGDSNDDDADDDDTCPCACGLKILGKKLDEALRTVRAFSELKF